MQYAARLKSLIFVFGVLVASGIAVSLDGVSTAFARSVGPIPYDTQMFDAAPKQALEYADYRAARIAWDFMVNNTVPETGWVNSVDGFESSTLWDQGSYVFALVSALRLGLIDRVEFDERFALFVGSLRKIELIDATLPNKVYNTRSLLMTDYADGLRPDGIGWSALDIARLLLALRTVERFAPQFGPDIRAVLARWNFAAMTKNGQMFGTTREDGKLLVLQEGRIGYEQYGARAAGLWGLDVNRAMSAIPIVNWRTIAGVEVPVDARTSARFGTVTPVLSEPYILMGLEMGFDAESRVMADRVFAAQHARFTQDGIMTFVSEDHVDEFPHFVYSSVFSNGGNWAVVDSDGRRFDDLRTQWAKATYGWDALFDTDYTNAGLARIQHLARDGRGWMAGVYENTGAWNASLSLNTNAIILEALHFKKFGPLWNVAKAVDAED